MLLLTPLVQKVPFDADKQLVPVVNVGTGTQMIAIRRSLPVKTLPEFIAYAKANPGKLNFVIAGANNIAHLAPVLLFARAGVDVVMIPAKSGPQAVQDLMAGQVDFYFGNASELLPHAESDKIRLIAVGTRAAHSGRARPADGRGKLSRASSSRRGTASRSRPERRRRSSPRSAPRSPRWRSRTPCGSA